MARSSGRSTEALTWSKKLDLGLSTYYSMGLISISALDANVAWAVGAGGYILKTSDGGVMWMVQRPTGSSELNSVSAFDANTAWSVGVGGTILHTTDGGGGAVILNINAIAPDSAANLSVVDAQITGGGFATGATVRLERSSTVINATEVVVTPSQIACELDLSWQPRGKYDLIVKNPNGQEVKLAGGFSITDACGKGGRGEHHSLCWHNGPAVDGRAGIQEARSWNRSSPSWVGFVMP
jgi:Photosynthesis system II assembly factor YCF48